MTTPSSSASASSGDPGSGPRFASTRYCISVLPIFASVSTLKAGVPSARRSIIRPSDCHIARCSREGAADPAPILDRVLLAGDDLDRDLAVAGRREPGDPLLDLPFGRGEAGGADQFGGDELSLLGLDEHQVAAMVFQVKRALRPEAARQLDIAGD